MFIHVHPYHTKPSCIPRWLMAAKASRLRKSTSMPHGRPSSIPQIPNVTKKVNKTESLIHVWATNLRTHCAWLQCGQSCIRSNKSFKFFSQKERPFPSLYFTGIVHWDKQVSRKLCYILGCRKSLCSALGRSSHPINSKSAPKNAEGRRLKRLLVTTADLSNWLSLLAFAAVRSTTAWVKDVKLPSVQVCVLAKWCKIPYQTVSYSTQFTGLVGIWTWPFFTWNVRKTSVRRITLQVWKVFPGFYPTNRTSPQLSQLNTANLHQ